MDLVPDTSVLVDGRISELLEGDHKGANVLVPLAALAELEAQANRGLETGFTGMEELRKIQKMAEEGACAVSFVGERPTGAEIERAATGSIDARIRDAAVEHKALFVTSDRVQAHAAAAQGVKHLYIRPVVEEETDLTGLLVWSYFDDETMSVHLKSDCRPMAKKGTPGEVAYQEIGTKEMTHQEVRAIAKECIEFAKRDYSSFLEMERHGCTVVQCGPMRITIAQPPFADGLEITAVRPVFKATLDDYDLPAPVLERIEGKARGVFVAGPPGSGKSTFAAAVAEHLHGLNRVVKTMESPRDLQVPKEITQYGPLDRDMAWTGEVMLLVRPDHVVYDEVRTTDDYKVFADMRLAGIGLFGVTHANRAIDGVQRLIGRVDLGMIPQIVDTVVFIDAGRIAQILELNFTVRTPAGMMQEDLARPVVVVKDFQTGTEVYELYSFGEQIVVMPLEGEGAPTGGPAWAKPRGRGGRMPAQLNVDALKRSVGRFARGDVEVEIQGNRAVIFADPGEVGGIVGQGGRTVQALEKRFGVSLDVRPFEGPRGPTYGAPPPGKTLAVRRKGSNVYVDVGQGGGGGVYRVRVEGDGVVGEAKASRDGMVRFKASSPAGKVLTEAAKRGMEVSVEPLD